MADAQDLPHDQEGQARRRHFQGQHHQHALAGAHTHTCVPARTHTHNTHLRTRARPPPAESTYQARGDEDTSPAESALLSHGTQCRDDAFREARPRADLTACEHTSKASSDPLPSPSPPPYTRSFSPSALCPPPPPCPAQLATEDYLDALEWAKGVGGYQGLVDRANANLAELEKAANDIPWLDFLSGPDPAVRSNTSVCLTVSDLDADQVKKMAGLLEAEGVALDIGAYRSAPPGFRVWCGPTVESSDVAKLVPWMRWAHDEVKGSA